MRIHVVMKAPVSECSYMYTGVHQIIGRNSRFFGYSVTKTKKNTEKKIDDSRSTQALSDSILFVSKFKV